MIFQLSDWFPKSMIWAIIVKFAQVRKNWWRISCAEILEVGKIFFAASSVKKMWRFEEVSTEEIKRIAWKFTKTVILLGLAGYELIITNSAYGLVGYIYLPDMSWICIINGSKPKISSKNQVMRRSRLQPPPPPPGKPRAFDHFLCPGRVEFDG